MTIEGADQSTLQAMLFGFAAALLVVLAALFQDVLLRLTRSAARPVGRAAGSGVRALGSGAVEWARALTRTLRAAASRRAEAGRARPARGARPAIRRPGAERAATPSSPAVPTAAAILPEDEPADPAATAVVVERRRRGRVEEEIGRRRAYRPASSIHVEQRVREFLGRRDGVATIEAVVRHLEAEFGPGLGRGLIEALQRRGLVEIARRPDRPLQLQVRLLDQRPDDAGGQEHG